MMFLLGMLAGQVYLGSNFTGRGWFRSKSGATYEGFKLEELKPWTWLILSPVLMLGVFFWFAVRGEAGLLGQTTLSDFYRGFLMPDCSNARLLAYKGDLTCSMHLMYFGTWIAAVGYSLAPAFRRRAWIGLGVIRGEIGMRSSAETKQEISMKEKTDLR
jgi:hypothetical protein